jgi:hypothetical protein
MPRIPAPHLGDNPRQNHDDGDFLLQDVGGYDRDVQRIPEIFSA